MEVVVFIWFIGILVAPAVMRIRAGAGFWRGLKVLGPGGFGPVWVATVLAETRKRAE